MPRVKVGETAPDFALKSQEGVSISLGEMRSRGSVVLYFYPRDYTKGCTVEAGAFRDSYEAFRRLGADVIGISSDSVESHRNFASDCKLPFRILSDEGGKVRKLYGVSPTLGLIPGRVTYVIDRGGVIRHIFSSQVRATRHVKEALDALDSMAVGVSGAT